MDRWRTSILPLLALGLLSTSQASAQFERAPDAPPEDAPAARPQVTPPKLIQFAPADYPPEAQKAGLAAEVVLRLTVDEQGNVTDAEVTAPVGNGFDEAAQQAALKFKFEPATRNGTPMKAKILYRYAFTLAAPEPDQAAPPPPPTVGNLSGLLRIAGADVALAGAEVEIKTPSGETLKQVSDAAGKFALEGVAPGTYHLKVTSPGFAAVEMDETVVVGEATEVMYRLAPEAEQGVLEVTVTGERPPREVTRRTIERREIERIPGTSGDAIRSIESLPGVARPPGFAGILIVRGSYPEDTQTYLDGSEIPLIYHFGGLRSVFPTELIERIDFYPGNYGAKYGRGMGGIVDVGLKSPETRCKDEKGNFSERRGCHHGIGQFDLIEGRVLLQGPLPLKNWSYAVGARRSWVDAWMGPVLKSAGANIKTLPVYYDYQLIAEHKTASGSKLSLRFYGADDRFAAVLDPLAEEPAFGGNLRFGTSFYQAQLLYERQLSSAVSMNSMVSAGRTGLDFGIGAFVFDLKTYPIQVRQEFGWKLATGVRLNTGFDYIVSPYDVRVRSPAPPSPGEPESGPFSTRPLIEAREKRSSLRQGFYADAEILPIDRWRIVPGIRFDYARDTGKSDVSPRINTRFDLVKGGQDPNGRARRRTTLKAGAGYYYQPPQVQQTNQFFGTTTLSSNRALHYALGIEQELTSQLDVSVEGFYKDMSSLVATPPANMTVRYTNLGTGRVLGLETLLRYKPDKHFFGWLAYTLSQSVRRDHPEGREYHIPYDQTHNLTLLGSYRLGRGWEFGLRFRVVSGNMTTPVRKAPSLPALYAADSGSYVPMQGNLYSERLPLFHQLDMRLDKRWEFQTYRVSAYLDVYNVYNNPGIEGISYDFNYARQIYQTGVPFLPSVGVRGEF
ncbi:MAG TPA: TonB-dependent receptor [Polyangiaceae bacterium]|nr:TonB-dependent receptor [Polyangiaceae bacterium]